jgi:serine/threonine protein kinase
MRALREVGPGSRLGRYEVVALVGEGGMGRVWRARPHAREGVGRDVALKTILPELAESPRARAMLLDEARIAARIEHPNVVRITDLGDDDGVLFLVMDWVEGVTLEGLARAFEARGQRLPIPVLVRVVRDAARGLHAAHELASEDGAPLSVVHRDVSPDNILVGVSGRARLTDFGIAKARQRLARDTTAGRFAGKVAYASPEHAAGLRVGRAADIWSLGAVVFRLLTGEPPFRQPADLAAYIGGEPSPPLPAGVPGALAEVVRRALSVAPEDRPASARELAQALELAAGAFGGVATLDDCALAVRGAELGSS